MAKEAPSQKYREVFFPAGMPSEQDPDSGQQKPSQYAFYSEAKIGDSRIAVLYSKKIPNDERDANYTVYLGLLVKAGSGWNVGQTLDLTEFVPVETEEPGNFYRMDGRVDTLAITNSLPGIHVNLWAVLAGSGSISGASDLFFKLEPDNKLEEILALKGTSKYFRMGASQSTTIDSRIFAGDLDGNGKTEIIVERTEVENAAGKRQIHSEKPAVYKLTDDKYKLEGTMEKSEIARHSRKLVLLVRSPLIRTAAPTPRDH